MFNIRIKNIILSLALAACNAQSLTPVLPYMSLRSQGQDAARELAGSVGHINLFDQERVYGCSSTTFEYSQSFKPNQLASALFGDYACNSNCSQASIPISGSRTLNRGANDWLADYFYLPTDFQSVISFSPKIQNAIADFQFYLGLDKWVDGLFFQINFPFTWTKWNIGYSENVINAGTNPADEGYYSSVALPRLSLLKNFTQYAEGFTIKDLITTGTALVMFDPLKFANIDPCGRTRTTLADIHLVLGWNFWNCENYHLGVGVRLVAPTGTRPTADYIFEPIAGNGKHWEIGAQFSGHYDFWHSCDDSQFVGFYATANITHMIRARQERTFDLINKPFSRYMLAETMDTPVTLNLTGQNLTDPKPIPAIAQFQKEFAPVANISTQQVRVSIGVQADIAAQFSFGWQNFTADLGYNFWGHSCEKITSDCPTAGVPLITFPDQAWALKGDAYVWGFASMADPNPPVLGNDQAVPLSATESQATILAGTNFPAAGTQDLTEIAADRRNPNIDNPKLSAAGGSDTPLEATRTANPTDIINTSIQPIRLQASDLALVGNSGSSHKIYMNMNYNWWDHCYIQPYIGFGGFAEFGRGLRNCAPCNGLPQVGNNCAIDTACMSCSLSQWGVWIKAGFSF